MKEIIEQMKKEFNKRFDELKSKIIWNCRFHPTDWWHEIGCPHQEWTKEQLQSALITAKVSYLILQESNIEAGNKRLDDAIIKALEEEVKND